MKDEQWKRWERTFDEENLCLRETSLILVEEMTGKRSRKKAIISLLKDSAHDLPLLMSLLLLVTSRPINLQSNIETRRLKARKENLETIDLNFTRQANLSIGKGSSDDGQAVKIRTLKRKCIFMQNLQNSFHRQ